jgi:hypothetical protein
MAFIFGPRATAQSQDPSPLDYAAEYSSVPMRQHAQLVDVGVRLIERAVDWGLDESTGDLFRRRTSAGSVARFGRAAFDFLVSGVGTIVAHEYGHKTRAEELGRSGTIVIRPFSGSFFHNRGAPFAPRESIAVFGAGMEGARVLTDLVEDRIHARDVASPADLMTILVNTVASEAYVLSTLSESRLSNPDTFLNGGRGMPGDPVQYVANLTAVRLSLSRVTYADVTLLFADIRTTSRAIRRGTLLNLLDYGLVSATVGLVDDYVKEGQRRIPVRWLRVGPVSLVPSLSYQLSPVGPERQARLRYKTRGGNGLAYVRWTEPLTNREHGLLGVGGSYQHAPIRGIEPKVAFDVWRNPTGAVSARGEVGVTYSPPVVRLLVSGSVGAKGTGYVRGYSMAAAPYFDIGLGLHF